MKTVIMFVTGNDKPGDIQEYDTVSEAQEYAEVLGEGEEFNIFTLYTKGSRGAIAWELQADTAANLREIKKSGAKGNRGGVWSQLEEDTLMANYVKKMPIKQIADALGRSYNACYCKINAIKVKAKKEKKAKHNANG